MSVVTSQPEPSAIASRNGRTLAAIEAAIRDDLLYEVVDGQVVEKIVGAKQVEIAFKLAFALEWFARPKRLGRAITELIFRIDRVKDLQRRPDAAFISDAQWPTRRRAPDVPVWDIVPELAIEVISPNNSAKEVQRKIHEYFKAGARRVWVVCPDESEVYDYSSPKRIQVLQLGDELDGGDLLPGFRLPLAAIFEDGPEPEAEQARCGVPE